MSRSESIVNFMGGVSFKPSPLQTLKFIASSSFFGEPSYYRDSDSRANIKPGKKGTTPSSTIKKPIKYNGIVKKYLVFPQIYETPDQTTIDVMIRAIDDALESDFQGTLDFAKELRQKYYMRLNPNIIFVRASLHHNRQEFNKANPLIMKQIGNGVIQRPDDISSQFQYYLSLKGRKNSLPNILKRIWATKLSGFNNYQLKKYLNGGKLIDMVRISHAKSDSINEMMKTGDIKTTDEEKTWEVLRAGGKTWNQIIEQIEIPHMALLRNLRGMATELSVPEMKKMCDKLLAGVEKGKQFPYRYYSAYKAVDSGEAVPKDNYSKVATGTLRSQDIPSDGHKELIKATLNMCIDKAMANFPRLKGKTISLCDNSGSAHGAITSSYGSTKISTIANLSGVMTAVNSTSGEVGIFGDRLIKVNIDPHEGVLKQLERIEEKALGVGGGTENGVWLFFDEAIKKEIHYDNIFIYSDMQAGHGGLYGTNEKEYKQYSLNGRYIDVLALVTVYREKVNPKVNLFSVQVAGYDSSVLPETLYRGAILSGWTGSEVTYASFIINQWDQIEEPFEV